MEFNRIIIGLSLRIFLFYKVKTNQAIISALGLHPDITMFDDFEN